ncbi:MAG: AAA family ATPase, partial [Chitinophagaceae bacterium]
MAQEPYNKNDRRAKLPKFNKNGGEGDNSPKKGPRFSFYWVYAIIFAVLIGFQLFGNSFSPSAATISQNDFEGMIRRGEVQEYTIISNRNLVKVNLNKGALSDTTQRALGKNNVSANEAPVASFKVASIESFKDDMREFYKNNPQIKRVNEKADAENSWFPAILQTILPFILLIGIWILLMRKMSGGATGGGGPGGIFNIGKSKATLFDKGTKVNITFADVAGLDEAKVEV